MNIINNKTWVEVEWDGNKSLGYKCLRKKFGHGYVSVGIGDFELIVYSYGANSDISGSSTRWRKDGAISEIEAMEMIDKNKGKFY